MDKSHRNLFVGLALLLVVAFFFNRWAFREEAPLGIEFFIAPLSADPELFESVARTIENDWKMAYAPLILETHPLAPTNRQDRLIQVLARGTGQPFGNNPAEWWPWVWQQEFEPHPIYPEFKARIYEVADDEFRNFFHSERPASVRLDEIQWTGLKRSAVPPLTAPKLVGVDEAGFLADNDIVYGVIHKGKFRAYPERITARHEVINDAIEGTRIVFVHSVMSRLATAYLASVKGVDETFAASGFLYRGQTLLYDQTSTSLWSSMEGKPVVGPLVGGNIELERIPVVRTSWGWWKALHPATSIVSTETGHSLDYSDAQTHQMYYQSPGVPFPIPAIDDQLALKEEVVVIRTAPPVVLDPGHFQDGPLFHGDSFLAIGDYSGAVRAYESGGHTFRLLRGDSLESEDGVFWSVTEERLTSEKGEKLDRIPSHKCFWFAWNAMHPDSKLTSKADTAASSNAPSEAAR